MNYNWIIFQYFLFVITPYLIILVLSNKDDDDDEGDDGGIMQPMYVPSANPI
jgi:hypothetical protein